ncbi:MAG: tripartite tricarboxylate transporter TctB family protein [Spirochaetia bacterium]|nr:tripartite tricarboxylate transporter TctB family protein [Spirochaetia bacterium]MCF7945312.1 tripartite tricarboxylate transporter TctB family protein [Spirochaetia bacterium]MCF7946595.1 tripartite tricarboxylate transporter TctB family protein [Spirochaetia bacterium]
MNKDNTDNNLSALENEYTDEEKKEIRSKNWPVGDIMISLLFIAYALFMFIGALNFTTRAGMGRITSPKFTPILLSILVFILCMVLIILTLKRFKGFSILGWFRDVFTDKRMQRSFTLAGFMTAYIIFIGIINFILINLVYFLVIYSYLKIGNWVKIILYSVACTLIVAVIVPYVFNMPAP